MRIGCFSTLTTTVGLQRLDSVGPNLLKSFNLFFYMEEAKFENSQAIQFGEAIQELQMNTSRDIICKFLNIPVSEPHPETGEHVPLTFGQAYSELINAGYFLNTFIIPVGGKFVYKTQILKPCFEEGIEVRPTFSVTAHPIEKETEEAMEQKVAEKNKRKKKTKAEDADNKQEN